MSEPKNLAHPVFLFRNLQKGNDGGDGMWIFLQPKSEKDTGNVSIEVCYLSVGWNE